MNMLMSISPSEFKNLKNIYYGRLVVNEGFINNYLINILITRKNYHLVILLLIVETQCLQLLMEFINMTKQL